MLLDKTELKMERAMKKQFKEYLFDKHYFVQDSKKSKKDAFAVMYALAKLFGIRIISGGERLQKEMISLASFRLGEYVPKAFYKGFPQSVRNLSADELLFDQLVHYSVTYGFGHFDEPGHSLFEKEFERTAFKEDVPVRDFSVLTEAEAEEKLWQIVRDLLAGSRPLSDSQYTLVCDYLKTYPVQVERIGSKLTAVRLLLEFRDSYFAKFLFMSDIIKVLDEINYRKYGKTDMRELNLKNKDRKFIASLIDAMFESGRVDLADCYEKKKLWCGLLHHIHYRPGTDEARCFVNAMRGRRNGSVYSGFERAMAEGDIRSAVKVLKDGKGSGALLRNLNYILSRCRDEEESDYVVGQIDTDNVILLIQLLLRYAKPDIPGIPRTFAFTKHEQMNVHREKENETAARKSCLSEEQTVWISENISNKLKHLLKGRLGRVYIDPAMRNYALPLRESTSQGGFGVLAAGTHIPIGDAKKIRAFTYWEKVNDIDLSVIGLTEDGWQKEFSWRTMAGNQSEAVTYSGDQTSGFYGGSEYYDVDLKAFRKKYPKLRYLIFCDNVYSCIPFSECICRAGYMVRDIEDSGQIYEPKTVNSAFSVNCQSTFAYLFGLDVEKMELIWLNAARSGNNRVAGDEPADFLLELFHVTDVINVYTFFEMMAEELAADPKDAELIVTNQPIIAPEGAEVIREYDFERMIALMN